MPELIVRKWDGPYSFMIFREYGVYKARRGDTGEVQFEDPSKSVVIQNAINSLLQGGTIFLREVQLPADVTFGSNILIVEDYQGERTFYSNNAVKSWWEKSASYIIWTDGTYIYAVNGHTGKTEFSGTDAATVIQAAINSISSGLILIKKGVYGVKKQIIVDDKIGLTIMGEGCGSELEALSDESIYGTVLRAESAISAIFYVGSDLPRCHMVKFRNLALDGKENADYCIKFYRQRNCEVVDCVLARAKTAQIYRIPDGGSPNLKIVRNDVLGFASGTIGVHVSTDDYVIDNFVIGCPIGIKCGAANLIFRNHIYGVEPYYVNTAFYLEGSNNWLIGNYAGYDTVGMYAKAGGQIVIGNRLVTRSGLGTVDAPHFHLEYDTPTSLWALLIIGNDFTASSGTTVQEAVKLTNVIDLHLEEITVRANGYTLALINSKGFTTENSGTSTFSGDGSTKIFEVASHGLGFNPSNRRYIKCYATPQSTDAENASPVSAYPADLDADGYYEGLRIIFASPPAAGTNNVVVSWHAELRYG